MEVYLIFERCRERDALREIRKTKEGADQRVDQLNDAHPRSDGFYCQEEAVQEP